MVIRTARPFRPMDGSTNSWFCVFHRDTMLVRFKPDAYRLLGRTAYCPVCLREFMKRVKESTLRAKSKSAPLSPYRVP